MKIEILNSSSVALDQAQHATFKILKFKSIILHISCHGRGRRWPPLAGYETAAWGVVVCPPFLNAALGLGQHYNFLRFEILNFQISH